MNTRDSQMLKVWGPLWAFQGVLLLAACGHAAPKDEESPPVDPVDDVEAEELFRQGVGLARAQDFIRSEQYLAAAISRGYPERKVLPLLLRVCVAASRLRIALSYADPYLERHPEDWALRYLTASIRLGMGDVKTAGAHLQHLVRTVPNEADPHYLLAVLLRDHRDDPEGARQHFARYLELAPQGTHADEVSTALQPPETGSTPAVDNADEPTDAEGQAPENLADETQEAAP